MAKARNKHQKRQSVQAGMMVCYAFIIVGIFCGQLSYAQNPLRSPKGTEASAPSGSYDQYDQSASHERFNNASDREYESERYRQEQNDTRSREYPDDRDFQNNRASLDSRPYYPDDHRQEARSFDPRLNYDARMDDPRDYDSRDYDSRDYDPRSYDPRNYNPRNYNPRGYGSRSEGPRSRDPLDYDARSYLPGYLGDSRDPYNRPRASRIPYRNDLPSNYGDGADQQPPYRMTQRPPNDGRYPLRRDHTNLRNGSRRQNRMDRNDFDRTDALRDDRFDDRRTYPVPYQEFDRYREDDGYRSRERYEEDRNRGSQDFKEFDERSDSESYRDRDLDVERGRERETNRYQSESQNEPRNSPRADSTRSQPSSDREPRAGRNTPNSAASAVVHEGAGRTDRPWSRPAPANIRQADSRANESRSQSVDPVVPQRNPANFQRQQVHPERSALHNSQDSSEPLPMPDESYVTPPVPDSPVTVSVQPPKVPPEAVSNRTSKPSTENGSTDLSIRDVLTNINNAPINDESQKAETPWWERHVHDSLRHSPNVATADVNQLLQMALQHSTQLKVFGQVPLIRETAIMEADSRFDWTTFVDSLWEDVNDPVGSTLTVGDASDRLSEHTLGISAGIRRRATNGGSLELSQNIGHKNSNSTFFVPNNQGTSRLTLSYTQPLLRGRGGVYNTSLTLLAGIDTRIANDEFSRQLESHLLEVTQAYWALYLERGLLAQRVSLYLKTKAIVKKLESRQNIDTQQTQLAAARAAFAERRSELVRAQAAVKNGETRIRGLLNAPDLGESELVEIIPLEGPSIEFVPFDLMNSIETAIQHRPEILQAVKQVKAGSVRLNMAKHEMLPVLNAVTELYVSGLRGDSRIAQAWGDQFSEGAPSYNLGLQFEVPIWRRETMARLKRRHIEMRQLESQYRNALQNVKNEVEVAVREINTSFDEMRTKRVSMQAAKMEAESIEARWNQLAQAEGSAPLILDTLLRAQERVTKTESDFLTAQMTYNLSLMNVKRVMGVLLAVEATGAAEIRQEVISSDITENLQRQPTNSQQPQRQSSKPVNSDSSKRQGSGTSGKRV